MFGLMKTQKKKIAIQFPVLCRFGQEDGVWTGVAEDLPVVVSGDTMEEAMAHLSDAILSHFEAVQEHGNIEQLIRDLQSKAKDYCFSLDEMPANFPLVKLPMVMSDDCVMAVAR